MSPPRLFSLRVTWPRFLGAILLLGFASATLVYQPVGAAPPKRPTILERLQQARTGVPPLGIGPFGRIATPGSISSITSTFSTCGGWTTLSPDLAAFTRDEHMMIHDPVRDRLLFFGGYDGSTNSLTNTVWTLSLGGTPTLTQLVTSGTPPEARALGSAIYDSVRDRLVVFGGYTAGSGYSNEVWALSLSGTPTWSQITPSGTPPTERFEHTAIYDATRDRMIVFGGIDNVTGDLNDLWVLTFSGTPTWAPMTPSGTPPIPRDSHSAVYDGPRDRMVVFGGYSSNDGPLNDTWALSLSGGGTWSSIVPNGGPPAIRYAHAAISDAPRNRMIVFGGFGASGPMLTDTWSLSFTNPIKWTQLSPTGPAPYPQDYFPTVYDPVRQRMVLFSGDQFWALSGLSGTPSWSMITPPGQVPRQRAQAAVIYDAPRQRVLVFGGGVYLTNTVFNDLWSFSLTGGGWTRIVPSTPFPPPRTGATATYDPTGDRLILFGGNGQGGPLGDTWQLSLGGTPSWAPLSPSGAPPDARYAHTAILDAPRNRIVVYGGAVDAGAFNDVWALSLAGGTAWSELIPTGGPAPYREFHSAVFDAPRNRMLTFGWDSNVVWALGLAGTPSWSTLSTAGTAPPSLAGHVAAYDAARDRMLLSMGDTDGPKNATYVLDLAGTPTWGVMGSMTPIPTARVLVSGAYDTGGDRWVLFGGHNGNQHFNDVEALSFPPAYTLTVQPSPPAGGTVQQNPAGECQLPGTMVTLTAVPAANYSFVGWSGDASGTTNPLTVTMNAAKNITANFDNYTLNVVVSPVAAGTVTKNPDLAHYPPNSSVTLTANPAVGYGFANWSGDATGSTNPLTVIMSSSKSITANFVGYPVNVSTSPNGAGTVTKNPNQATYAPGTQVTLTASSSFPFLGWSGDATGTTNPLTITVDGPKNITANFNAYTVTTLINPAGSGSVSKSPDQSFYRPGTKIQLTATAVPGYLFSSWSGDLTSTTNSDSILVNANKTVTANFTLATPTCGGWSTVPTASQPQGREGATAIWDPVRHRMLVSGGVMGYYVTNQDLWSLTLGGAPTWTLLQDMAGNTVDRWGFYDPVRDRMLVVAGVHFDCCTPSPNMETWAVSLTGPVTWTQITTAHNPPARNDPSVIYDPLRDRLILFGGGVVTGPGTFSRRNDVWQLNLSGTPDWTQITPAGTPPPVRMRAGAIYDPVRDRMVIMAGDGATPFGAWALSLSGTPTWSDLNPWGAPHQTTSIRPIYDAARDRAVIVWGDGTGVITTLDFKGNPNQPLWAKVYPLQSGGALGARVKPAVVYDSDDDLILVAGGSTAQYTYTASSLRLDLSGGYFVDGGGTNGLVLPDKWCYGSGETATLMGAPNQGYQFSQWFGDATGTANPTSITVNTNEVVRAEFVPNVTGTEEALPLDFGLEVRPNPALGPAAIEYSLPREASVRLRVFDISGREVERLVDGAAPAGRHLISWGRGRQLRAGIYLICLDTPAGVWTKRLALLR